MFWKKEVKEETQDLAESVAPLLNRLTAKMEKTNAMVDFLMESKKVDIDKFTRVSEQIGELRGEVAEREKKIQNLEAEATKASELVKAVQPEKLFSKIEKESIKIETIDAKMNSHEKIFKEIIKEMKDIKRLVKAFKGTEQVIKLNQEVKEEIILSKNVLANVDINASKVEKLFTDFNKEYLELKSTKENTEKIKIMFINLKKELDSIKITILELRKMQELMDTEKMKKEQEKEMRELIKEKDELRRMVGELRGLLGEIREIEKTTKSNKEQIELIAKESQKRHMVFQDLFLQFQKNYQETKQKEKNNDEDANRLKKYIDESLKNKIKKVEIRKELLKRGWPHKIVEEFL